VLAQGDDIVPIPGTKRRRYLDENLKALEITLTLSELGEINTVFPPDAAHGTRYPEAMMTALGR
jgi:aryl-alcohol dehydrogenase-like predicted oxidoreductase